MIDDIYVSSKILFCVNWNLFKDAIPKKLCFDTFNQLLVIMES